MNPDSRQDSGESRNFLKSMNEVSEFTSGGLIYGEGMGQGARGDRKLKK